MNVGISLNFWLGQLVRMKSNGHTGTITALELSRQDSSITALVALDEPIIVRAVGELPATKIWNQHVSITEIEGV